ncbi:MAG TPA: hypothetical protein VGM43_23860 [Bryobacteraceae bacterium]|jgi:hypothetical protein
MITEELPDQQYLSKPDVDEEEVKPAVRHWSPPTVEIIKIVHFRQAPAMKNNYGYYLS